jgi:hypothetical protein
MRRPSLLTERQRLDAIVYQEDHFAPVKRQRVPANSSDDDETLLRLTSVSAAVLRWLVSLNIVRSADVSMVHW